MRLPGWPSLLFLAHLLGLLPWLVLRSAARLRAVREGTADRPMPPRTAIWQGTLLMQCVLLVLAIAAARSFGAEILASPSFGPRGISAALAALAACFGLRALARAWHTDAERRRLLVFMIAPRTRREWALFTCTVLVTAVAEEAAYRGVAVWVLSYALGSFWIAVALSVLAFAVAHWTQGAKGAAIVAGFALVLHGLVIFTGTLVFAMVVHAAYDLVAGWLIGREAPKYDLA